MPSRRMMDMRNPYGSEGGYVTSERRGRRGRRGGRRDRAMGDYGMNYGDYGYDMARRGDYGYDMARGGRGGRGGDRAMNDMAGGDRARGRDYGDYESDMARGGRGRDRAGDYADYEEDMARGGGRGRDGHYPMVAGYMPIEAMGRFTGYYGMGDEGFGYDMARGGNRGGGRDRGYEMDYGYDYAGDYGERLTKEELEEWKQKLLKEVPESEKQFFTKEQISPKAKQMGLEMKDYNEEELVVTTAMVYSDYCKTAKKYIGNNMNFFIEIARDWLEDKDAEVKGGEKLAIYHDCIVEGED